MTYEVEQKFRSGDLPAIAQSLDALGAQWSACVMQVDEYFAHPARDFAQTDEALRIRRVEQDNFITYKGPKLDATIKTRREIEIPAASGDAAAGDLRQLLIALGFRPVAAVRKQRRTASLDWQDRPLVAALDEVDQLGTFVELELLAGEDDLEAARAAVGSLAERLGLTDSVRRSYLTMLLAASGAT